MKCRLAGSSRLVPGVRQRDVCGQMRRFCAPVMTVVRSSRPVRVSATVVPLVRLPADLKVQILLTTAPG
jgi:hypothetical protein